MKIISLLTSDRAEVETKTNKLNVWGVFNSVGAPIFPTKLKEFFVTVVTEGREGEKHHYRINIKKDGKEVVGTDKVVLTGPRHYFIARFYDIVFVEPGAYTVEAMVDNEKMTTNLYLKVSTQS